MIRSRASLPFSSGATRGGWLLGARTDPITGLVAFPDFHRRFPKALDRSVHRGQDVVIAIGDVDDLKTYVEDTNRGDDASFGHLAGNALMSDLGTEARSWLATTDLRRAALSTFGGDEIIFAAALEAAAARAHVEQLRDRLCARLPRTISFAYAICSASSDSPYLATVAQVDRALFTAKRDRGPQGGLIVEAAPRPSAARRGRVAEIGGTLVITFDHSEGDDLVRGRRYRVGVGDHSFVAVAYETNGRLVLRLDDGLTGEVPVGSAVDVHLVALSDRGPMHVPQELQVALDTAGVSLDTLSQGERRQFVMFVREGRDPEVRQQRIAAVVHAVQERS
jgi:GGDEF domain-containing protein